MSVAPNRRIVLLSFKTAAQLRKHRSLKDHFSLGRGRSVISQLHKCGLEPVKASETDWKTKNQEKNRDARKKKKRSKPKTQRERKMIIMEQEIEFDEETDEGIEGTSKDNLLLKRK